MRDFLATMVARSAERVVEARRRESDAALARRAFASPAPPALRLSADGFDVIAEIKQRSPADGALASGLEGVGRRAAAYAGGGAAMVSVLTEPSAFHGSLADVADAARAVRVPVLRKDFLVDPYQVLEARAAGAGAVLLILRMLDDALLATMLDAASQARLVVLLEAFDADDLDRCTAIAEHAGRLEVGLLVGVNARDLATLGVDAERHARLAAALPAGVPAVAASGIGSAADTRRLAALGYRLALVGTALMRAPDPEGLVRGMVGAGREARCASA